MSSEIARGRNQYAWMAPKPTLLGVFGAAERADPRTGAGRQDPAR